MYHYTESGLSNVYLKNGVTVEVVDGEEYTSIDDMNGLHSAIAQTIVNTNKPLAHDEFKFLRVELNVSQKMLFAVPPRFADFSDKALESHLNTKVNPEPY